MDCMRSACCMRENSPACTEIVIFFEKEAGISFECDGGPYLRVAVHLLPRVLEEGRPPEVSWRFNG